MRTLIILIFVILVSLPGCNEINSDLSVFKLTQYNSIYLYPWDSESGYCCIIEYKDKKVSKVIYKNSVPQPISVDGSFSTPLDSYYEFSYYGDFVELTKKIDNYNILYISQKRKLTKDKTGKIITRIDLNNKDTTNYYYNKNGLLEQSIQRNGGYTTIVKNYFFDSKNNLFQIKGEINNIYGNTYRINEHFQEYDNSINGFKDLGIIEGAFIRSLSQNNFYFYSRSIYDDRNSLMDSMFIRMPVNYDKNGYPIYGNFTTDQ